MSTARQLEHGRSLPLKGIANGNFGLCHSLVQWLEIGIALDNAIATLKAIGK